LQAPAHPVPDQPVKPPAAAPRQPVHEAAKTPVVAPHGPAHPHKPHAAAGAEQPPVTPEPPPAPAPPVAPAAPADNQADAEKPEGGPPKLPRFASLRSDEVNMRAGPGLRYRIDWVYKRRDLPVEIMREFDVWRWVRDADGIEGWMQQATLMGRRSFIVQKADATLRSEASDTAAPVAILKSGVIGRIRSCEASSDWCNVQSGSYRGYLRREQFWGAFPGETVNP
jgi:SH3-like domain-containing protein